jgi:hypothetical protein
MNRQPRLAQRKALHVENAQAIGRRIQRQGVARKHCQTHAGGDQFADGFVAVDRQLDFQPDSGQRQMLFDRPPRAGAGFAQNETLAGQRAEIDRPRRCPMVGRRDHHLFVVEQRVGLQRHIFRRIDHDVEIVLIAPQTRDDALAVGDLELDVDPRVAPAEFAEHARQEILGGGHQRHPQAPPPESLEIVDGGFETAPDVIELARRLEHLRAGRRQHDLAPGLLEERQAEGIDDLPDLQRNRGLGQMQRLGGFREAALVSDRDESFELAESHPAAGHV